MAVSLGQAVVEIIPDTKGFGKDVEAGVRRETSGIGKKAGEEVGQNFSSGIGGALKGIGAAVAAAGVAKFAGDSIKAATDLNEQLSKTEVVFGDAAESVIDFGKNAATSIGASKVEALTATGTFGNLLRSVGLTGAKAADMSVDMVQLAGDLASFNNVPVGEALDAIRSGLVGETEPLKKFAVNLNEATIKAEAMRLGLDTSGATLSATTKAQATYSLIMKQTSLAQGDFERTSASLANQQRILSARFQDAKADIGEALLPAMLSIVGMAQELIPSLAGVGTAIGSLGTAAVTVAGPVLGLIADIIGSDMGTFAITAGLAAIAIGKIGSAASKAFEAVKLFAAGMTTAQLAMGGIGLAVAAVVTVMSIMAKANADAHERQTELAKAQLKAGDPAAVLADTYTKLAASAQDVADAEATATEGTGAVNEAWVRTQLAGEDVLGTLDAFGIKTSDVFRAVTGDAGAYDEIIRKLAPVTTAFGVVHNDVMDKARDAVQKLKSDSAANVNVYGEAVRKALQVLADTDPAVKAQLALAESQEAGSTGGEHWLAVGRAMAETNPAIAKGFEQIISGGEANTAMMGEQTKEAAQLEAARGRLATATQKEGDQVADVAIQYGLSLENAKLVVDAENAGKDATKANTDAKKALADALDEARQAQENYLFVTGGAQVQVDDVTSSVRDLTKGLGEGAEAAGRNSEAFEGNTKQAIDNRSALQQVYERAQTVINGYDDLGLSSDQAKARQAELAQSMYDTAIAAGATEAEAAKLRDGILLIPEERNTKVKVAEEGTAETAAAIDDAARRRNAVISVSLSAVGVSDAMLQAVLSQRLTFAAQGAMVGARRGGSLLVAGEAGQAEAVVPLTRAFQRGLAAIAAQGRTPAVGSGAVMGTPAPQGASGPVINVSITGTGLASPGEARHLGRIVGESAAQVLAQRQLATSMRTG